MKSNDREWLTLGVAAEYLGVAQSTVRKWADEGRIPTHKTPGGHRRFRKDELDIAMGEEKEPEIVGWNGGAATILVVDDDQTVRTLLREIFIKEGFHVIEASNAYQGIEQINKQMPDLLLLDVSMPGMDGLQMMQKIREKIDLDRLPILIFSGVANTTILQGSGAQGWTSKPFDPYKLVRQAKGLLLSRNSLTE